MDDRRARVEAVADQLRDLLVAEDRQIGLPRRVLVEVSPLPRRRAQLVTLDSSEPRDYDLDSNEDGLFDVTDLALFS